MNEIELLIQSLEQLQSQYDQQYNELSQRLTKMERNASLSEMNARESSESKYDIPDSARFQSNDIIMIWGEATREHQNAMCKTCEFAKAGLDMNQKFHFECLSGMNKEPMLACSKYSKIGKQ